MGSVLEFGEQLRIHGELECSGCVLFWDLIVDVDFEIQESPDAVATVFVEVRPRTVELEFATTAGAEFPPERATVRKVTPFDTESRRGWSSNEVCLHEFLIVRQSDSNQDMRVHQSLLDAPDLDAHNVVHAVAFVFVPWSIIDLDGTQLELAREFAM